MDIIFIIILVVTSIIAVTFIIERGFALRWAKVIPPYVSMSVLNYRSSNDLPQMQAICQQTPSPISRLLLFATEHLDWPKHESVDVLETRARQEVSKLERGLVVLEIIVGIAPLLGLVGTIYGLIVLFGGMGKVTADQSATFASGISLALNSTLMGLLIAIPALAAWSYYSKKVETLALEMESLCDEFLRKHYTNEASVASASSYAESEVPVSSPKGRVRVSLRRIKATPKPPEESIAQSEAEAPPAL